MDTETTRRRRFWGRRSRKGDAAADERAEHVEVVPVDIAPNDPIIAYFQGATGAVDLDGLELESPAKDALQEAGVKLVVPLISQGELIGLLNLGPRRSERDYSGDDRKLLDTLAAHAAPAVRVAQLVKQQESEVRTRERLEQEMRVAQLIQQQFLPKDLPQLSGWQVAAYYQPARAVGGDFYDFVELPDGKVGIVVGDVTDKGVPAALVMATTHSLLRAEAPRLVSPAKVLARVNSLLVPDIPAHMFITCLYAVLDPATGELTFANAGHNLPYVRTTDGVIELRATGMPLGLMPDMTYDEVEVTLDAGQAMLLYSDGVTEAHSESKEMFGFDRLKDNLKEKRSSHEIVDHVLEVLSKHTGSEWEQEDDITLVSVVRAAEVHSGNGSSPVGTLTSGSVDEELGYFTLPSEPGRERDAMKRIAELVEPLGVPPARIERLKTAVAEATMNAMEHGNGYDSGIPVSIRVLASDDEICVYITDQGGGPAPDDSQTPDLEAKLQGEQSPRGWGLFLIKNMVDEMDVSKDEDQHTVKLVVHLRGAADGS